MIIAEEEPQTTSSVSFSEYQTVVLEVTSIQNSYSATTLLTPDKVIVLLLDEEEIEYVYVVGAVSVLSVVESK